MSKSRKAVGQDKSLLINIFAMPRKRRTFKEKQNWILERLDRQWERERRCSSQPYAPSISSGDEADEQAWHEEFGGYRRLYTIGAHNSPDFARTLREMYLNGILYRVTGGNQGAREGGYAGKTYYVAYYSKQHWHEAKRLRNHPPETPRPSPRNTL